MSTPHLGDSSAPQDDVLSGWAVFDRRGGGYAAVWTATGHYVETADWDELTAAVVDINAGSEAGPTP